jgi:hypothetical protein
MKRYADRWDDLLMNKVLRFRLMSALASFGLVFLLTAQAFPCLLPSPVEMSQGRAMACCADHCRMETTPEAAQKACEQSRQAFLQHEVYSNASLASPHEMVKLLPDSGTPRHEELKVPNSIRPPAQVKRHVLSKKFTSVKIYTFVHSFLI